MSNNPALSKAIQHFKENQGDELQSFQVEEWDITIYHRKRSNFKTEQAILKYQSAGDMVGALVETILQKALNAEGKRMFAPAERAVLMNEVDPQVLISIATQLNQNQNEFDVEATAKN